MYNPQMFYLGFDVWARLTMGEASKFIYLKNIVLVYHYFRQLWLVLRVKLMEINSKGCFPGNCR